MGGLPGLSVHGGGAQVLKFSQGQMHGGGGHSTGERRAGTHPVGSLILIP